MILISDHFKRNTRKSYALNSHLPENIIRLDSSLWTSKSKFTQLSELSFISATGEEVISFC